MKSQYKIRILFFVIEILTLTRCAQIDFEIRKVPNYYTPLDDNLFIAASFNSWASGSLAHKLTRHTFDTYSINLEIPLGIHEYKFTRGTWATGETGPNGEFLENRRLFISTNDKQTIDINIQNWDDMKGQHTANGHVYLLEQRFPYPQFGRTKRMWVYLPPDYFTALTKSYSVLYMQDGQNIFDSFYNVYGEWDVDKHLETLYYQGFQTSIVVGVETQGSGLSGERLDELTPCTNNTYGGGKADLYLDFLINNVKPYIDSRFRTKPDRINTGIAGSSLGGLFSFYAAMKNQDIFGKAAVFSPSFWFCESFIFDFALKTTPKHGDFRVYLVGGGNEGRNMVPNIMRMHSQLLSQGYTHVTYTIDPDGTHTEQFWSKEFTDAYNYTYIINL